MDEEKLDTSAYNTTVPQGAKVISLPNGRFALVDEEDYETVKNYKWSLSKGYVRSEIKGKNVRLHRFVMNITDPEILVDHRFHDKLDNRKSQLRVCNNSQNQRNRRSHKCSSSEYKGVCWDKENTKWKSSIYYKGKSWNLGRFSCEIEAARAYDVKAREFFKEFAYLNFKL